MCPQGDRPSCAILGSNSAPGHLSPFNKAPSEREKVYLERGRSVKKQFRINKEKQLALRMPTLGKRTLEQRLDTEARLGCRKAMYSTK